jgi:hypothetical protein
MWAVCSASSYAVQQIRDGLYSVSGSAYNTMFPVTSVGVIAVDARTQLKCVPIVQLNQCSPYIREWINREKAS